MAEANQTDYELGHTFDYTDRELENMSYRQMEKLKIDGLPLEYKKIFLERKGNYLLHQDPEETIKVLDKRLFKKAEQKGKQGPLDDYFDEYVMQRLQEGKINIKQLT